MAELLTLAPPGLDEVMALDRIMELKISYIIPNFVSVGMVRMKECLKDVE